MAIANRLVSENHKFIGATDVAALFPEWPPRRINSALNYLDDAKVIHSLKGLDGHPYVMSGFRITDQTRRFVRDRG